MKKNEIFEIINKHEDNQDIETSIAKYLVNLFFVILFSLAVVGVYYKGQLHNEAGAYLSYFVTAILVYCVYKFTKTYVSKDKITFSPLGLMGYAFINLMILSGFVFTSGGNGSMVMVFKIIGYCFLPFIITIICYSFARKILGFIKSFNTEETPFKFLISLGFGFTCFSTVAVIFALVGLYNYTVIFGILLIFAGYAFREVIDSFTSLWSYKIEFKNHKLDGTIGEAINLNLLSAEFSFVILSFLIGVNFINIVRPMPIGWDDLGAYMNIPQIMANSGSIPKGIGFMAWQLFTGIGYMFHSAPQAFFLNQVGGILSIVVLIVVISDLLKTSKNKHLSIPIIIATMFYSMPMVIFQQAKDMKLDPALFFVSVIGIYLVYKLVLKYLGYSDEITSSSNETLVQKVENGFNVFVSKITSVFKSSSGESKLFENKDYLILLFIIGTIVGLAFAVKFTTLMLIIGLVGVIFYAQLGLSGFLAYFTLFVAIFTKLHLWDMMNINYPKDNISLINNFSYGLLIISALIFVYSYYKYSKQIFIKCFSLVLIFSLGIIVPLVPWMIKNISDSSASKLNIGTILNGTSDTFVPNFNTIYTKTELQTIEDKSKVEAMDLNGKTTNEDLGRYFGYENGINNYLKLPWNLTLQSNQSGEYTEITFFFLALIPILLLFLAYKNYTFSLLIVLATITGAIYFNPQYSSGLTAFFDKQTLPFGYVYIVLAFFLPLVFFLYSLKNDKLSQVFKVNSVFFVSYTLLFVVAAYGIVWYGIAMYFALLLMIGIGLSYISEESKDEAYNGIKIFGSAVILVIISIYFFNSTLPHGMTNIAQAGFLEFKSGKLNQEEGIFSSHPDYFVILANLNINNQEKLVSEAINSLDDKSYLKSSIINSIGQKPSIGSLEGFLREITFSDLSKYKIDPMIALSLKEDARPILNNLYNTVLYPSKDIQNKEKIYRIGTFLTYFISNNRTRYFDDSLVTSFGKYFYDNNPDVAVDRMSKVGLKYLLTDLNAATIDKDPRRDLTTRYEKLLKTFSSNKLELIQTDSICLRIAIDEKDDNYMTYAGVNYESYSGATTINRISKLYSCYNHVIDLMKTNKIDDKHYSYLLPVVEAFKTYKPTTEEQMKKIMGQYITHGWMALFKIK